MASTSDPPDTQCERLRAQIRGLEEQLQRLVRTEQRLYYAQREVGRQLRRVAALNAFSIDAARRGSEREILQKAIATFFSLFAYDEALVFLRRSTGQLEWECGPTTLAPGSFSLDGCELPTSAIFVTPDAQELPQPIARAIELFDATFGPPRESVSRLLLPLCNGVGAPSLGFFLFRRVGAVGFHDDLATPGDLSFLELFGHHVGTALTQFRLVEDLRHSFVRLAEAQEDAVQRERLAALGELAAVVAHEVRNPVAVIFNAVAGLRKELSGAGEAPPLVRVISEEATRLEEMVSDLLDFARPSVPDLETASVEEIARQASQRALQAFPEQPRQIRIAVDPHPPMAMADARLLHQATLNLLINALQASPPSAPVLIRIGREERGEPKVRMVKVEVIDHGPGIAPDTTERIFQPFFTTKAKGSGLGLAVVKKVVDAHHGEVRVDSTPGHGSTFTLWIPEAAPILSATG